MNGQEEEKQRKAKVLREKAEDLLVLASPESNQPASDKTLHELQVHQIELEMQNEELRRTQVALEQTQAHYRDLYDFAPTGYLTLDTDGIILELNLTATKMFQVDRAKVINKHFTKFVATDYQDLWYRHFQLAKQVDEKYSCELPFNQINGSVLFFHLECLWIDTGGGQPALRITLTDVTERKRVEIELRIAATAFQTQNCVVIADARKTVLRVNEAFTRITGYRAEEANKNLSFFNPENPESHFHSKLWAAVVNDGHWQGELWEKRKNGEPFLMAVNITSVKDNQGVITHYVADFSDITARKKAEEALRESEERLRLAMEGADMGSWEVNVQTGEAIWNRRHALLQGYDPNSGPASIQMWKDRVHPDDLDRVMAQIEQAKSDRGQFSEEHRVVYGDGRAVRWLSLYGRFSYDETGEPVRFSGVSLDITERKQAEQALRESEAQFRSVFENAASGMAQINVQGRFINVNDRFCQITGYSHDELVNKMGPLDLDHPDEVEADRKRMADFFHTKAPYLFYEKRYIHKVGNIVWVRVTVSPIYDDHGNIYTTVAIIDDITEGKRIEAALSESEDRLYQAIHLTKCGIFDHDHQTGTLYWSPTIREIYGVSSEEPASLDGYIQLLHPDDRDAIVASIRRAHDPSGDGLFEIDHRLLRSDGTVRWISLQSRTQFDGDGPTRKPVRTIGAIIDITERKQAEEALRQKSQLIALSFEPIFVRTIEGTILEWNQGCQRLYGYSSDEAVGSIKYTLLKTKFLLPLADIEAQLLAKGSWTGEIRHRTRDGREVIVDSRWQLIETGGSRIVLEANRDITERKQAEATMRRQAQLIDLSFEPIFIWDMDKGIAEWNRGCEQLYGYTHAEAAGQVSHQLLQTRFPVSLAETDKQLLAEGIWAGELRHITQDGREVVVESRQQLVSIGDSRFVLESNRDITERKQAEATMRRQAQLIDLSFEPIFIWDMDKGIAEWNRGCEQLYGYTHAEAAGQVSHQLLQTRFPVSLAETDKQLLADGIWAGELRHITQDGREVVVESRQQLVSIGDSRFVLECNRNITERKKQEEQINIAAAAFEAQESIMVTDANWVILRVNKAFTRILGYSAEDAIGKTPLALWSDLYDKYLIKWVRKTVKRDGFWQGEVWSKRKNGEILPVLQTITRVTDKNGKLTHYVGTMVDITLQKQAEKVLLKTHKLLENQVSITQGELALSKAESADINTALNVLIKHRDAEKSEALVEFASEVGVTALPMLEKLKKAASTDPLKVVRLLDLLENDLKQLLDSNGRTTSLAAAYKQLTAAERKVATMVRQGYGTKQIATAMNLSPKTIDVHRKHIRKKLGLATNLALYSYLTALDEQTL